MSEAAHGPVVVLHVFGRMTRGGAETRTVEVMRRLDPTRHRLVYCALTGKRGEFDEEIRELGGEVYYCRLGPTFPWRFVRLLRRVGPDIVHSHVHLASGFILLLARVAGVRGRIAHFRSSGDGRSDSAGRRIYRHMMRMLLRQNATRILAVSQAAMAGAMSSQWEQDPRCRVVPNGIDVAALTQALPYAHDELGIPQGSAVIASLGRDNPAKNRPRVLSVFAKVARDNHHAVLLFIGRDQRASRASLEDAARALGVSDRVFFLGQRDDVPRLLASIDLLLAPSVREGSPGAILEAVAAGVPVLASDISSISEVAAEISEIQTLPLSADDDTWAARALDLLGAARQRSGHTQDVDGLGRYSLEDSVQAFIQEWEGASA
jgi:glycosyltransferase involved in cell wall biosynthesis